MKYWLEMKKIGSSFKRIVIIGILVLTLNSVSFEQAYGDSTVINVTDDAYVNWQLVNNNYGSAATLNVSLISLITWLKFDLSSIPKGAEISYGDLELHTAEDGVTNPHFVDAKLLHNNFNNSWSEKTITASNQPPFESPLTLDTEYVDNNETTYEWDVTAAVVAALHNNVTALTIVIQFPSGAEAPQVKFKSKEGNFRPNMTEFSRLTLIYDVIPEFSLFSIPITIVTTVAVLFLKRKVKQTGKTVTISST